MNLLFVSLLVQSLETLILIPQILLNMRVKLLFATLLLCFSFNALYSQVSITNASPAATVNFSATMQTSVGTNPGSAYTAAGFSPNPTVAGRLNSNAWEIKGWSFGDLLFGGTQTVDDFGRGPVNIGVVTPGMYVYTDFPGTAANPAMMIQPGAGDFAPGTITLKIRNDGTSNLTQLSIDYNLFVRNDENTSSSFNFSHSADNVVFADEPVLDYTSPDTADAFQWVSVGTAPSRTCIISGLNIAPGGVYFIRWSSNLVSGTGDRDEFGLDDIHVTGTYGSPAPEINVTCYGNTLLTGDTTPTVGEGTEFAPSYAPMSTLLTTLQITYYIQNLGGLPLNISNVTITGAHPSDFIISGAVPTGSIPAASATISSKQFVIIFDPSDAGLRTARVNIFSDDSNENPYWFDVQGYGVIPIPDIRVNADGPTFTNIVTDGSLIPNNNNNTLFSNQVVGGPGETKLFAIRNETAHNAPLILTDPSPYITISGNNPADFSVVTFPNSATIGPGVKKQFSIRFAPTATGIRNAIVSIASNDPDAENPYTFLVQGVGVAAEMDVTGNAQPVVSGSTTPSFVNHTFFDYLNINTGMLDRTFTITNSGTVALTVGALSITGANASDFTLITPPAASVASAGTTTFTIRFDPSAVGLRNATVSIVNTDPNENPYTFAISGYGIDYIPCAFGTLETIAIQDFEASPATPLWTYTATGTSTVAAGTAFGVLGDGGSSGRYLGARSLQVINGTATVTMSNINTTQYNDIELNLRLASMSVTTAEGTDVPDKVTIAVSANGGPWSNELEIVGNTDAKWSFASGTGIATTVYDGNNILASFNPGSGGYLTTNGYSTVSLSGLPSANTLSVRITAINNNASEIWAIDNVTLFGRKELSTTWTGSWSAGAPTPTVKAIIDANYDTSVNGNISSCKCVINAGRTVTINTNNYFDIQSDIDNSGTLVVENGGSLVQRNDMAANVGSIRVKRFTTPMRAFDYTYWSSPVAGQTLFGLSPNTLWDKYFSFNPVTGGWAIIPNGAAVMQPGKGYIIRAPQNFTTTPLVYAAGEFNGVPNNGFIQTPIVLGVSNMNLIGNPYPSAISANAFLSNAANTGVVEGTIYLWTHNTPITALQYAVNDYAVYNFSGSVGTAPATNPGINNTVPTGNIASGQGFFIKGLANGQATFNNSMRLTGSNNSFFRPAPGQSPAPTVDPMAGIEKNRVWLNLTNSEGAYKQTLIGYIEGATNEIDRGFDGELYNANTFVSLYSIIGGKSMAIQGRALPFDIEDKVPLGYNSTIAGMFEISIDSTDGMLHEQAIYLEDKLLNVIHDLQQSPYSFETAAGTFNGRFELRYTNSTLATDQFDNATHAVIVSAGNKLVSVYSQEENIRSIAIYDVLGRNILEVDKVASKKYSTHVTTSQQALIVKIVLENGAVVTRKIIL